MRHVEEIMTRSPLITIELGASVAQALRLIAERGVSHLLVMERERLAGVVCACDLEQIGADAAIDACACAHPPLTVESASTAFDAAREMLTREVSCLPVMRAGRLVGIVTASDLRRAGLLDPASGRCAACGSRDHVRCAHGVRDVGFCLECTRKSEPPRWDEDVGGG